MDKPKYYEDDEKWAEWEAFQELKQEEEPEPLSSLQQIIEKARGIQKPPDFPVQF